MGRGCRIIKFLYQINNVEEEAKLLVALAIPLSRCCPLALCYLLKFVCKFINIMIGCQGNPTIIYIASLVTDYQIQFLTILSWGSKILDRIVKHTRGNKLPNLGEAGAKVVSLKHYVWLNFTLKFQLSAKPYMSTILNKKWLKTKNRFTSLIDNINVMKIYLVDRACSFHFAICMK